MSDIYEYCWQAEWAILQAEFIQAYLGALQSRTQSLQAFWSARQRLEDPGDIKSRPQTISIQRSSAHVEERDQELWGTLEQDCLWLVSAKNNKSVSDWSIQVCTRAVERAACLACERVFP